MTFEVPLLPLHSLGRNFQLYALSVGSDVPRLKIRPDKDSIVFSSEEEYKLFIAGTYSQLARIVTGRGVHLTEGVPEEVRKALCEKDSPRLYGNDTQENQENLQMPGDTVCERMNSYVERVISKGPLTGEVRMPMALRTSLYSKERPAVSSTDLEVNLNSLGMSFIGMMLAYIGGVKKHGGDSKKKSKKESYEYYVVPVDLVERDVAISMIEIMKKTDPFPSTLSTLEEEAGIGSDRAVLLALLLKAVMAAEVGVNALGLARDAMYESFLITKIRASGKRPDVVWNAPLSLSVPLIAAESQELAKVLTKIYRSLRWAKGGEAVQMARKMADTCLNALFTTLFTGMHEVGKRELIYSCARVGIMIEAKEDEQFLPLKAIARNVVYTLGEGIRCEMSAR